MGAEDAPAYVHGSVGHKVPTLVATREALTDDMDHKGT